MKRYMEDCATNKFGFLVISVFLLIGLFYVTMPYIETEIATAQINQTEGVKTLCKPEVNNDFKKIKAIFYSKPNRKATIYCLYENADKNTKLRIYQERGGDWKSEHKTNLGDSKFYWPLYF